MEFSNAITSELIGLGNSIENGLDFDASQKRGRPVIRFGLDEALDESNSILIAIKSLTIICRLKYTR